jgi:Leucine-rich repeat (LRR) protein
MKLQLKPLIAITLLALAVPGRGADAPTAPAAKAPEIRRVAVRYFGGTPVHAAHQEGDWMETKPSMRYRYEGGTRIAYEQEGSRTFVRIDDGPRRLVGISFGSAGGSEALREAIAQDACSFVIRCPAASLRELPPLPQGRDLGLAVDDTLSDLAVLERFSQLSALNISLSGKPDLSPLRSLPSLTTLEIESGPCDITPLAGLRKLGYLKLNRPEQNVDLSPLVVLPELRSLELIMPRLPDLTSIGKLSQLTSLCLFNGLYESSGVANLGPISQLTELRRLELRNIRRETDLTPLPRLTKLTHLSLEDFPAATNTPALGGLRNLKELSLQQLPFADTDFLNTLTQLEYLSIRSCHELHDLAPVWKLANLKQLWLADLKGLKSELAGNALDLRLLAGLPKLEALTLFPGTAIGDLSPLANLPELWLLRLGEGSASTNPAQLAKVKKLTALGLSAQGESLDLGNMPRITSLELYGAKLSDLSFVSGLRNLEALVLATPLIYDLRPLTKLPNLKSLMIMDSPVEDLAPLAGLDELRDLQIWMCPKIASLEPLSKLPNLMTVDIEGYNKVDLSPLCVMERRGGEVVLDSLSKRLSRLNN